MGHRFSDEDGIENLLSGVKYNQKSTEEIREAIASKLESIRGKLIVREARIQDIRGEYSIDAERLASLVIRYKSREGKSTSYESQGGQVVPAGVVANLVEEHVLIDSEKDQVQKLELVLRNLQEKFTHISHIAGVQSDVPAVHTLSDTELEYLGF